MNRIIGVPIVLFLFGVLSCSLGQPVNQDKYASSLGIKDESSPIHGSEVQDLLLAGSSPKKSKKHVKNAAGKSNEGGYYKTYGSDAEGEKGYLKQTYSKGDHGYKTRDNFHKRDGGNYAFERSDAFGGGHSGHGSGSHGKSGAYSSKGAEDHEGAGTEVESYYAEGEGDNAGYTEAEEGGGDGSGESSAAYTDGGDSEHYTSGGGDAGHYSDGGSGSGNYENSDGYNEHHSSGGGDEGSYASHGSYSSDGDGGGDHY